MFESSINLHYVNKRYKKKKDAFDMFSEENLAKYTKQCREIWSKTCNMSGLKSNDFYKLCVLYLVHYKSFFAKTFREYFDLRDKNFDPDDCEIE
jgi:hypothetical protein